MLEKADGQQHTTVYGRLQKMAVLSIMLRSAAAAAGFHKNGVAAVKYASFLRPNRFALDSIRNSGHKTMAIKPSRWSWNRFKDLVHFYLFLGAIPATVVILYVNLFIGPARLAEIPQDYNPEPHEYHSHPITRWLAKNVCKSYQQEYEMMLHHIYEEEYKKKLRLAERRIHEKMKEKDEAQTFYYEPYTARYHRFTRENDELKKELTGSN